MRAAQPLRASVRLCCHNRRGSRSRTKASPCRPQPRAHDIAGQLAPTRSALPSSTARRDASDCLSTTRNSCRPAIGFLLGVSDTPPRTEGLRNVSQFARATRSKIAKSLLGQPIEPPCSGVPLDPAVEAHRLKIVEPRAELRELIGGQFRYGFFDVFKSGHYLPLTFRGRRVIPLHTEPTKERRGLCHRSRRPNAPSVALSAAAAAHIHLRPRLDDLLHRAVSGERRERLSEGAPHRGNLAAEPFGG